MRGSSESRFEGRSQRGVVSVQDCLCRTFPSLVLCFVQSRMGKEAATATIKANCQCTDLS